MAERVIRSTQPRVSMGGHNMNYQGRLTRAQIVSEYTTPVNGNDSTLNQERLPGEWTLVKETNMESREPQVGKTHDLHMTGNAGVFLNNLKDITEF